MMEKNVQARRESLKDAAAPVNAFMDRLESDELRVMGAASPNSRTLHDLLPYVPDPNRPVMGAAPQQGGDTSAITLAAYEEVERAIVASVAELKEALDEEEVQ
eukprot:COSAG04_NODE_4091_length_2304_cov_1210.369112_3_plen_103_part_00